MARTTNAGAPFRVTDDGSVVTAQKLFTRTGERLDVRADSLGASIKLDAIALESLAWQDPGEMSARAADVDRSDATGTPAPLDTERTEPITVSNEFAQARLEKVTAADGEAIEITAPKLGYQIRLGPRELEWVALQDHETFTTWLEHPFGPAADEHEHPH